MSKATNSKFDSVEYIKKKLKNDKEYTDEEREWIKKNLLKNFQGKKKYSGKAIIPIYMETIKTWKYRKGKVGEVVYG